MHQRVAEANSEKIARERLQEEIDSSSRTIKKLKERQEALAVASSDNLTAHEWQMKEERDKLLVRLLYWLELPQLTSTQKLLRCSCCEQNFKQQVIVKCMHSRKNAFGMLSFLISPQLSANSASSLVLPLVNANVRHVEWLSRRKMCRRYTGSNCMGLCINESLALYLYLYENCKSQMNAFASP